MTNDMTSGNIPKQLVKFAIPMVLGNMFQLTYNAVDSIIVGHFVGTSSLAAVGAANPIMNIVIFFIVGICMGTSVLMSEYFGEGNIKKLKREISTSMIVGLGFTIIMSIICFFLSKNILLITQTPIEIVPEANLYLRTIFCGLIFTFLYNIYSATLRSMGDSKTPILFLIFSSILNAILAVIFVVVLKLGVLGTAIATVISQAVSSILCIIYVYKKIPILRFSKSEITVDTSLLKNTINYSWVTALQQTCLYIGKLLVQGSVNPLGVNSIAAFNAVTRIDDFALNPEQSISSAMTTFIAQNRGGEKFDRIKKAFHYGMLIEVIYWLILIAPVYLGARSVMQLFVPDSGAQVIHLGVIYLESMAFFYILPGLTNGLQGYFRGMGDLKITLISTFVQILSRVILSYILAPRYGIAGIAFSCLFGWIVMLSYEVPAYLKYRKKLLFLITA
ncbi:MATE family efflux transporter [Clostridium uliginosum]|uniref:Probable multidrug resistance protein NorM n=1 Tax=Clostridium uliginosum TaxID=119641 RepID=A0A1I1H185_9CLOT|nr:MATE family efflux transporter [Clostridium uliginosum]SFC17541.1 putative efflux protein, MATE family [Clostridium uliginosum]